MKIIDLSQTFENGMPQFPNTKPIHIEQIAQIEEGGFRVTNLHWPVHNILMKRGIPFIENLNNLEKINVERFFFSAAPLLIDKSDGGLTRAFAVIFDQQ